MTVEEIVRNTPLEQRPPVVDEQGRHPMGDAQYAAFLGIQQEQLSQTMPVHQEIAELKRQNYEMRRMLEALASGDTGEVQP